jgi:hypothetical protein
VKHVYFIAETKGSLSSMELPERSKIECARKFFARITSDQVTYDVVASCKKIMEIVQSRRRQVLRREVSRSEVCQPKQHGCRIWPKSIPSSGEPAVSRTLASFSPGFAPVSCRFALLTLPSIRLSMTGGLAHGCTKIVIRNPKRIPPLNHTHRAGPEKKHRREQ